MLTDCLTGWNKIASPEHRVFELRSDHVGGINVGGGVSISASISFCIDHTTH